MHAWPLYAEYDWMIIARLRVTMYTASFHARSCCFVSKGHVCLYLLYLVVENYEIWHSVN